MGWHCPSWDQKITAAQSHKFQKQWVPALVYKLQLDAMQQQLHFSQPSQPFRVLALPDLSSQEPYRAVAPVERPAAFPTSCT